MLGFTEIIQMTCVIGWLADFCMRFAVLLGIFQMNCYFSLTFFQEMMHDSVSKNDRHLQEFKDVLP